MEQFFQQVTNGLAVGGIYALVALGYTMVYGVLKLINFAHGDLFTCRRLSWPDAGDHVYGAGAHQRVCVGVAVLIVLVMLLVAFLGAVLERTRL